MITHGKIVEIFNNGFKTHFKRNVNKVFEQEFKKLNMWGYCEKNENFGVLTNKDHWHPLYNRPNTNSSFAKYIIDEMLDENPNEFKKINDKVYYRAYGEKIGVFLEKNFKTYFTNEVNVSKYNHVRYILKKSWFTGNVTMLISVKSIYDAFKNIKDIQYGFSVGELNDFAGIDATMLLENGDVFYFQVKTGRILHENNSHVKINGSVNDLEYKKCNYYVYSSLKYDERETSSLIFKNTDDITGDFLIKKENIIYNESFEMKIAEIINEIGFLSLKSGLDINMTNDKKTNDIKINEKEVTINIFDVNDKNFEKTLMDNLIQLKKLYPTV